MSDEKQPEKQDEELTELRKKHPRGIVVRELSDGSRWVFRKPTADEYRQCKGDINIAVARNDGATLATAYERLAHGCCLVPGADGFQSLRDDDPGIASAFGEQLFNAVGTGRTILAGKADS